MANRGTSTVGRRPTDGGDAPAAGERPPPDHPIVSAFNGLRDELLSTLVYVLGNRDDALDAAQEAFLKCWKHRDETAGVTNLRAWIFRVGLNTAKDQQRSAWNRKVKPMATEEIMIAARDPAPGTALEDQEAIDRLRAAIVSLRPDEKEVFLLRQNGDLTYEQIAEIRNAPVGTVKTQMRTALIKLRRVLNPADGPADLPDA
jgi:RNA polymerase sigma-70 factor (ECF subfamily)